MDHKVGRVRHQRLGLEAVADSAGDHAGIARSLYVDSAVAHHDGVFPSRARVTHDRVDPDWIGLLELEAVTAVDVIEVTFDAEPLQNLIADADRLIGKNREPAAALFQAIERIVN